MDSIIISLIILLAASGIVLLFYPRGGKDKNGNKAKAQETSSMNRQLTGLLSVKQNLEHQLKSIRAELERTNEDCQILHDELEKELDVSRTQEGELRKEILRLKNWGEKEKNEIDKVKKENIVFKERLFKTEKESEKEFSVNIGLRKTIKELDQRLAEFMRINKEQADKIRELENQGIAYRKAIAAQQDDLAEHRRNAQESEWISKAEYLRLSKQLEEKGQLKDGPKGN